MIQTSDMNSRKEVKNKSVLFPRNKLDTDVWQDYSTPCQNYLQNLWSDHIGDNAFVKWEKVLLTETILLSEKEREILVTR